MLRALLLGLGWINLQLDEFRIGQINPKDFSKDSVARIKPLSELALSVNVLMRCGVTLPFLPLAADWIWNECEEGHGLLRLLLARNDFLPACSLYASLFELGYRSAPLDAALRMLAKSKMARRLPLQPWARLALDYNLFKLGIIPWSRIRRSGLYVVSRPEPWVISGEIGYAITHEIMYLTDFGFEPLRDAELDGYLRTWIPYWAQAFTRERDWDVLGELAMISSCLGTESPMSELAIVLAQQAADGSIAGPDGAGSFLYAEGDTKSRRAFLASYHTTLVGTMAAAMALRRSH